MTTTTATATKEQLEATIQELVRTECVTELQAISAMQTAAATMGDEDTLSVLIEMKRLFI